MEEQIKAQIEALAIELADRDVRLYRDKKGKLPSNVADAWNRTDADWERFNEIAGDNASAQHFFSQRYDLRINEYVVGTRRKIPAPKLTNEELEALSVVHQDEALMDLDTETWAKDEHSNDLIHTSGARIQMTGTTGRWVAQTANGKVLRGKGRGIQYFKKPTAAIAALLERQS